MGEYDMPAIEPEYDMPDASDPASEYLAVSAADEDEDEDVIGFGVDDEDTGTARQPMPQKIDPSVYEGMTAIEIEEYNRGIRAKLEADTLVKGHTFELSRELRTCMTRSTTSQTRSR